MGDDLGQETPDPHPPGTLVAIDRNKTVDTEKLDEHGYLWIIKGRRKAPHDGSRHIYDAKSLATGYSWIIKGRRKAPHDGSRRIYDTRSLATGYEWVWVTDEFIQEEFTDA